MIFFLDIDGVLATMRVQIGRQASLYGNIDPVCVKFINHWGKKTNAYIVFTSTWKARMDTILDAYLVSELIGLTLPLHDSYKTKSTTGFRGDDIREWIKENGEHEYIIIDDDSDFHDDQKERLIKTDGENGILLEHHIRFEELTNAD